MHEAIFGDRWHKSRNCKHPAGLQRINNMWPFDWSDFAAWISPKTIFINIFIAGSVSFSFIPHSCRHHFEKNVHKIHSTTCIQIHAIQPVACMHCRDESSQFGMNINFFDYLMATDENKI
jgi:hypothetical protein